MGLLAIGIVGGMIIIFDSALGEVLSSMNRKRAKLIAIDLFSGCGGLTLGLKRAGYSVVAAVENEPLACSTFRSNHKKTLLVEGDIRTVDGRKLLDRLGLDVGELDLVAGCPPCQGFSTLRTRNGGRKIREPMNDLVFEFLRIVEETSPRAVMMENVPGLAVDRRIEKVRRRLVTLGYQCKVAVFDAVDFGVPQKRKRMIFVGLKGVSPEFAEPKRRLRTVRGVIDRLPVPGNGIDPLHDYEVRRAEYVLDLIKAIPKNGGSRTDLPKDRQLECHKRIEGFRDIYGRMSWERPAPTITGGCINPSKGRFLHPEQDRAITLREAAMLQGFPRSYRFDMSRGRYPTAQMIGNAFPPIFAEHHARRLRCQLAEADA